MTSKHKEGAQVKNAADPKQVKRAAEAEKERDHQYLSDVAAVMETKAGRRLIYHIINDLCHYDTNSAVPSGSWTYYNEGEREVGRKLKDLAYRAAFGRYQEMEKEHVTKALEEQLLEQEGKS